MKNSLEDKKENSNKFNIYSKPFIFLSVTLLLSVTVLAFYSFSYDKDVNYEIVGSKKDLVILIDLTDQVFNVSENLSLTQNLKLVNQNGNANIFYNLSTNITNLDPGNCTMDGDITFEFRKDNIGLILPETNFTMDPGVNDFNFTAIAINNRVCPMNITTSLTLTEIDF